MGDEAIDMTLDAFEEVLARSPRYDHRHRVEHLGNWQLAGQRLERVSALGLIPVPNPVFLRYLGETTIRTLEARRSVSARPFGQSWTLACLWYSERMHPPIGQ